MRPHPEIVPTPPTELTHAIQCYISGPMSGVLDLNRPAFAAAQQALQDAGYAVVNPFEVSDSIDWHTCMRADIKALVDCDGVATLDGWERSRGAKIEVSLATRLGMPARPWQDWVREARG